MVNWPNLALMEKNWFISQKLPKTILLSGIAVD
jgi:hypothetical protein